MARSFVHVAQRTKYLAWEFSCSCGSVGPAHSDRARAEAGRQHHMRKHHSAWKITIR